MYKQAYLHKLIYMAQNTLRRYLLWLYYYYCIMKNNTIDIRQNGKS